MSILPIATVQDLFPATGPVAVVNPMLILLLSGKGDAGQRATLAFSAACSALALDKPTTIFMVGDGAIWGYRDAANEVHISGFPTLEELVGTFLEMGGKLCICSTCASHQGICSLEEQKKLRSVSLREGVEVIGFSSMVEMAQGASSLTF